jgi:hypothetical protein
VYKAQRAQLPNLFFIDRRLKTEVELVEGFHERQVRQLQPRPQVAHAPRIHFAAQPRCKWAQVPPAFDDAVYEARAWLNTEILEAQGDVESREWARLDLRRARREKGFVKRKLRRDGNSNRRFRRGDTHARRMKAGRRRPREFRAFWAKRR